MQDTDRHLRQAPDEQGNTVSISAPWPLAIKRYLLLRKDLHVLSYQELVNRLTEYEIHQSARNLSAKYNQGTLSATLFVASLLAMGEENINLRELAAIVEEIGREQANATRRDEGA